MTEDTRCKVHEVRVTDAATGGQKGQKQEQWSLVDPAFRREWLSARAVEKGVQGSPGHLVLEGCLRFEEGVLEEAALEGMLLCAKGTATARELANVYGMGSQKYARGNWRKGYAWGLTIDALWRHTVAWLLDGEETDPESGLRHAAHGLWHVYCLMDFVRLRIGTDDRLWVRPR